MCHSTDSRPPAVADPGSVAEEGLIELTSQDGTAFTAFHAQPDEPNGRGVVILPDIRGVHAYYQELARRFAEAGFPAVVLDYYGRTAGLGPRDDAFEWEPHFKQLVPDRVAEDARAAVAFLTGKNPGVAVFSVGFCLGGGHSWRLAGAGLGLAGSIGFYGLPGLAEDRLKDISAPLLLLLAGNDVATSQEDFAAFRGKLDDAGKSYEYKVYEGAPHSFFDGGSAEWKDISADAWRRVLDFTARHAERVA
ncbi:dienelactone hydrolase family protein [Streptomyces rubradiris]|uniref:Carboxymethylenebutenolidase n=1 Tax=Streptomyces rubradiris TaxID=285531 RepID=A0ABQ3R934_STRRR|nr:dienelactone hydrolase family protein [Streptomyces rubradiris]GHG99342.1 carboxymethylenebutenolidase [Streptomyces rubradiris]GHI52364.1 carboxymethylenebutenolidase [Streptomyces rubradiris]